MAKEKTEKKEKAAKKEIDIKALLSEEFGNVFHDASVICDNPPKVVSFSPCLDIILGGGIPEGSFGIFTGPPKCGKTTSALHFAGNCQKELGSKVFFFNIEGRLKKRDLEGIKSLSLDPSLFQVIGSEEDNILTAEKYISICEKLINNVKNGVFVIDSFSSLCTEARYNGEIGDRFRDDTPLLLANFCKRVANVIPIMKSVVIGITHMIANQGMGHSPWVEASGRKLQYQTDVKLKCSHNTSIMAGETQVGQEVHWECLTSAIGAPGMKTSSILRYGYGLDKEAELVKIAADFGIIKKGGAWFTFYEDLPNEKKFQGAEKARDYLEENPDVYKDIYGQIQEMLGLK